MKNILVLLFLIPVSCVAQSIQEDVDTLLGDYQYEYVNGDIPVAEKKAYNLIQVMSSQNNLLYSTGVSDNAVASESLTKLNSLLGTSYSMPLFNFDQTVQSYVDVDSIQVGGLGYQDSLITWAGVQSAVAASTTDTALIRTIVSDTADALRVAWRSDISDSIATLSIDSSYTTISTDSLYLRTDTKSAAIYSNGSAGVIIKSNNAEAWTYSGYNFTSSQANGVQIPNTSTNDVRVVLNKADANTGVTWASADKIEFQAGDSAIAYAYETSAKEVFEVVDSFVVGGYTNHLDSVYMNNLIDAEGDEQWLGLSATGAVFADSITAAGYGLTDPLIDIYEYMEDIHDGELSYYYTDAEGNLIKDYSKTKNLREKLQEMQWFSEHLIRYTLQQQMQIDALEAKVNQLLEE